MARRVSPEERAGNVSRANGSMAVAALQVQGAGDRAAWRRTGGAQGASRSPRLRPPGADWRGRTAERSAPSGEHVHHVAEQLHSLVVRALEAVAPHDGAEGASVAQPAHLLEDLVGALRLAAREDDDALPVERALHHVAHAFGEGLDGDVVFLEDLLRFRLVDELGGRLDLDDVRAELAGDVGGVPGHVHRRLPLLVGDALATP